jgi:hypothetical protein
MPRTDTKVICFTRDDGRRVYATPVKLTLECTFYVLASDPSQARRMLVHTDIADYFAFDPDSLSTAGAAVLKINDVIVPPNVVDLRELTTTEYPPNQHPDFAGLPER